MNRRKFLGSAIGASLAFSGLFELNTAMAIASATTDNDQPLLNLTDGDIAVINHQSSLERIRALASQKLNQINLSEAIIYGDLINMQFLGDYAALDRLTLLSEDIVKTSPESAKNYILAAQIAASRHEFKRAGELLSKANDFGADASQHQSLRLSIQQATDSHNGELLSYRKELADKTSTAQNLVPYGALLAENGDIEGAAKAYKQALNQYKDASPFVPAWICFQLGVLWGETIKTPNNELAYEWYSRAIEYLPQYTAARVHLSEIQMRMGKVELALNTLLPAISTTDPEVSWRLSEIYLAKKQYSMAEQYLGLASALFNNLLDKHELAFADHAAEFYLESGQNRQKALMLAQLNYSNRPTARARSLLNRAITTNQS